MRLRRDPLRIDSRTSDDAPLPLSRLPTIQRWSVFVFRHRADGRFQAPTRVAAFPWLTQSGRRQDASRLLPRLRLADRRQVRLGSSICRDQSCEYGWSELVQPASRCVDIRRAPLASNESHVAKVWKVSWI